MMLWSLPAAIEGQEPRASLPARRAGRSGDQGRGRRGARRDNQVVNRRDAETPREDLDFRARCIGRRLVDCDSAGSADIGIRACRLPSELPCGDFDASQRLGRQRRVARLCSGGFSARPSCWASCRPSLVVYWGAGLWRAWILASSGFLIVLLGLLWECVRLYRLEREGNPRPWQTSDRRAAASRRHAAREPGPPAGHRRIGNGRDHQRRCRSASDPLQCGRGGDVPVPGGRCPRATPGSVHSPAVPRAASGAHPPFRRFGRHGPHAWGRWASLPACAPTARSSRSRRPFPAP